jgi:predicted nucleotidyltransferase
MRPTKSQSYLRFPLSSHLGNEGAVRLLRVLFAHGGPLSVSQLARDSGLTARGARQTIETLMGSKLLKRFGQSRSQVFSIDFQNPLANALKELFDSEQSHWEGVLGEIRKVLAANEQVDSAWYYGSAARGEDTQNSDFDIVVLTKHGQADAATEAVRDALQRVEDRRYVTCSVVGLSSSDVMRLSQGDAWWDNVVHDAKVLKGVDPEQYLAQIRKSLPR